MRVLVAYASAFGSTKGIAQEIGVRLAAAGLEVDVRTADEIRSVDGYDAVVVGSAVHNMRWLPQATDFVQRRQAQLASRPVWLFSVGSVGDTSSFFGPRVSWCMRAIRKEPKTIPGLRQALRPVGHRSFAGAVEPTHWDRTGNLFLRALGGRFGDHRDWQDVDAWADRIAGWLDPRAVERTPPVV